MAKPGALVHAGREHHDRALVEDDLELEAFTLDLLEHGGLVRHPSGHDDPAGRDRHALPAERERELRRRRLGQPPFQLARGQVEERTVLRHDRVEQVEAGKDFHQVVEIAARDEQQLASAGPQPFQRLLGAADDAAMLRQRLVVVGCERDESHGAQR